MCNIKRTYWLIFLALIALAGSMLPFAFTEIVQAGENKSNLEELTANADSVIEGTVIERNSYWNDEHNRIYTSVVLSVGVATDISLISLVSRSILAKP